jgi:hypothetical protein
MNKDLLNNIQKEWENTVPLRCLEKSAGIWDDVKNATTKSAKYVATSLLASVPATAVFGALLTNKVMSPRTMSKISDKLLLRNTLKTEAAVLRRKIAELETSQQNVEDSSQAFDRFV